MNPFDYLLIAVLMTFSLFGFLRGFVREVLLFVMWPLAAFLGWLFSDVIAPYLTFAFSDPTLQMVVAFVTVFVVVFILGIALIHMIHKKWLPARGPLAASNTVLGGAVGVARGVSVVVIAFLIAGMSPLPQRAWWQQSRLAPFFQKAALATRTYLPADVARHIHYG